MAEFFAMGGHGFYIWTSYAIVTLVLGYCFMGPRFRLKRLVREIGQYAGSGSNR